MAISATERVRVIEPGRTYVGKQGFTYGAGASAETVGAQRICMNILPMPDGARAKAHYHRGIETDGRGSRCTAARRGAGSSGRHVFTARH